MNNKQMTEEQWYALPREERIFWRAYDDAMTFINVMTAFDRRPKKKDK